MHTNVLSALGYNKSEAVAPLPVVDYFETFIREDRLSKPYILKSLDGDWRTVYAPVSDSAIARHLQDSAVVGLPFPSMSRYLILDVDNHGTTDRQDEIRHFLDDAQEEIGQDGILFRSSQSGGVHAYFPLDGPAHAADIREHSADRLDGLIARHGLHVDMYPTAKSKLRLPLGIGSAFLDSRTFEAITDKREALRRAQDAAILLSDGGTLLHIETARMNAIERGLYQAGIRTTRKAHTGATKEFLSNGITGPGQTNDAACLIAAHYVFYERTQTAKEATARAIGWFEANHNGHSRDWTDNRPGIEAKLRDFTAYFWSDRKALTGRPSQHVVTNADTADILAITDGLSERGPITKRKAREFLYTLAGHLRNISQETELDGAPVARLSISYIQKWKGFGMRSVAHAYRDWAEDCQIIERAGDSKDGQKYRVHWNLATNSRRITRGTFSRHLDRERAAEADAARHELAAAVEIHGMRHVAAALKMKERNLRNTLRENSSISPATLAKFAQIRSFLSYPHAKPAKK